MLSSHQLISEKNIMLIEFTVKVIIGESWWIWNVDSSIDNFAAFLASKR